VIRKLVLAVLVGALAVAVLGVGAAPAAADVCVPGSVTLPCDPFVGLAGSITLNAPPVYRSGLLLLAGVAQRLYPVNAVFQPSDPCHLATPGDPCRPFLASFAVFRLLELTNAAVAGSPGYTCNAAGAVAGTIQGMHQLYPADLFVPVPPPITPGDPCHLLTPSL
jgi:hypothetical protein